MKKNVLIVLSLINSGLFFSQIGVNTPQPKSTFDIAAKNPTGTSKTPEGLLIPRVDRQRAQSMENVQQSTLIYVNNASTGSQTGNAVNIDAAGYYYFNGNVWLKINNGAFKNTNLYNDDGTLTANRTVSQLGNKLAFTSSATSGTNHFSVDGNTFSVDAVNNRVGVNTITPQADLQVLGNEMRIGGASSQVGAVNNPLLRIHSRANADALGGEIKFNEDDTNYGYYIRHNTGSGSTVGYDGLAIGAQQPGSYGYNPARPGLFISNSQFLGLGTATPQQPFHIDGNWDNSVNASPTASQQTNDVVVTSQGNMGIGTVSPLNKLDIRSNTSGALRLVDGTQGANKILTSDANGVATWKDMSGFNDTNIYNTNGTLTGNRTVSQAGNSLAFSSTATTGTSHFSVDGSTFSVDAVNNRIGIGTTTPKNLLDLGSGNGKKLALWNSTAGDDFYGLGNSSNVLQIYAGGNGDALMTLNKNGRVGIGTTNPQANLHMVGTRRFENATVNSVPVGAVLTATDTNGTAEWKRASANVVTGTVAGGINIKFENDPEKRYTGNYIILPPGKWIVNITQLIRIKGSLAPGDGMFVRGTFSDENLAIGAPGTQSADVIRPIYMSFMVIGNNGNVGGTTINDVKTGSVYINSTSGANKTYRYIVGTTSLAGNPSSTTTIEGFGYNWAENSIYATSIN